MCVCVYASFLGFTRVLQNSLLSIFNLTSTGESCASPNLILRHFAPPVPRHPRILGSAIYLVLVLNILLHTTLCIVSSYYYAPKVPGSRAVVKGMLL